VKQEHQQIAVVVPIQIEGLATLLGNPSAQSWILVQLAAVQSGYSPHECLAEDFSEGGPSPHC